MVRGDSCPGRGQGLAEEDDDEYQSRMDRPPDDVVVAMSHEVKREQEHVPLGQHAQPQKIQI